MRRSEKKSIIEMLATIGEAHREYEKLRTTGDDNASIEILTGCQESAVSIGNAIDKSEREGTESVRLLEKYCEDLYQASQGNTSVRLDDDLAEVRQSIMSEIPVILEVVFFPYKASMWDSMESIYLAFKARKDVHVYLVPIPYYNRKNDGTVESLYCESNLFPDDEKITDWRAFDVAKIKPDIAFIHNPYDDGNYVTTVDPRFYSFELKKNVDCLVYCPYFSTVGMIPKGQSLCKAYFYADYILTQSEYQADTYDSAIPKEKFLTMGSPKFDKVIRLSQERISDPDKFYSRVPAEWRRKCAGKKVYFYNTSLTGMLGNTPTFFDKMEYIFRTFTRKKDALLLWRPHPLFEDTLKALRPAFYDRYLSIIQGFLDSDIGILDDTPDISTSVAFCDAFIGDGGTSVTSLFVVAGKPMFILDNAVMREPTEHDITDVYFQIPYKSYQGGYIITRDNILFRCDNPWSDSIKFNFVDRLSDYLIPMYSECCKYGDDIFLIPIYTEDVLIYHSDGTTSKIQLDHCTDQADKFFDGYVYGKYIILVPNEYPYFVRVDMETGEVVYTEDIRALYISEDQNFVRSYGGSILFHNFLYVASRSSNRILQIDIETMECEIIEIGENKENGYAGMSYIPEYTGISGPQSDSLILFPYKGMQIQRYFPESGEVVSYDVACDGFYCSGQDKENVHDDIMPFSSAIMKDNLLFLAPYRGNKFIVLDTTSGKLHEWKFPLSLEWQPHNRYFTGGYKGKFIQYDSKDYWLSATKRRLYEIVVHSDRCEIIREILVKFDVDEIRQHASGFCQNSPWWTQYGLQEDAVNSLGSFLSGKVYGAPFDRQKELDSFKNVAVNLDGTCAQHVCDFLMKKMELS